MGFGVKTRIWVFWCQANSTFFTLSFFGGMNTLVILPLTILLIVLGVKAGPGEAARVPPVWPVGQQTGGDPGVIIQPVPQDQAPISVEDARVPHATLITDSQIYLV